jgi:hypothetical protein
MIRDEATSNYEKKEYEGWWYLPQNEKTHRVYGKAIFHPNQLGVLVLYGVFEENSDRNIKSNYEIVLGETWNQVPITLVNVFEIKKADFTAKKNSKFKQIITQYSFNQLIYNYPFSSKDEMCGKSFYVPFSNLRNWFPYDSNFKMDHSNESKDYKLEYNKQKPIKFKLMDCSCQIYSISQSGSSVTTPNYWLDETHWMSFKFKNKILIKEFILQYIKPLEDFFSFAMNTVIRPEKIAIGFEGLKINKVGIPENIQIIEPNEILEDSQVRQRDWIMSSDQKFLSYNLGPGLGSIINNWLLKYKELNTVFEGYLATFYNTTLKNYPKIRYLTLLQSIESYCRIRNLNLPKPDGLKSKLKSLILILKPYIECLVGSINIDKIAQELNYKRQYLTHLNPNEKDKFLKGSYTLDQLIQLSSLILELIIITEIEIPEKNIFVILNSRETTFRKYKKLLNQFN